MIVVTLARKPLMSTVAGNALKHGTGGLNIDLSRIGTTDDFSEIKSRASMKLNSSGKTHDPNCESVLEAQKKLQTLGRWPANLILMAEAATGLDEQSGVVATGTWNRQTDTAHPFGNAKGAEYQTWKAPKEAPGGASRYFKIVGGAL